MRIGIDARLLGYRQGGIESYISHLLGAFAKTDCSDEFAVLQGRRARGQVLGPKFRFYSVWTPPHHRFEQLILPLELIGAQIDLLHCTDFIPPFRRRCKAVITVHDLAFLRLPNLLTKESERYYGQVGRAVQDAEGIITDSEATRADICDLLGVNESRVEVVNLGIDTRFRPLPDEGPAMRFCQQHGLPPTFLLWVGTISPRKNLDTLLKALALLRERDPRLDHCLVVAGENGWLYQDTLRLVDELRLSSAVRFYGRATDEDLQLLYNTAWAFAFPSLYEGFGLPALEAMACGTPVVSSDLPVMREMLGDAAVFQDPQDAEAWASTLLQLHADADLRRTLRERGLAQVKRFDWGRTAQETIAVYHKVLRQ